MTHGRITRRGTSLLAIGVIALLASLAAPGVSSAANFDVATYAQLSAAITAANANADADTITVTADITLTGLLPQITTPIDVIGGGHTLDGAGLYGIFFNVGGTLGISQLTLANGKAEAGFDSGGAIVNYDNSSLTVAGSTFSGNAADGSGGAIDSVPNASLTVADSTFSGNSAVFGGAIRSDGTATIVSSTFSGNSASSSGGAIVAAAGSITNVTNSTFSGNSSSFGGAIRNDGTATIVSSTFSGNGAPNSGSLLGVVGSSTTLRNSIVANSTAGDNCGVSLTDGGGNIQFPGSSCGASIPSKDPLLDPAGLQANGSSGPKTIALLTGSPAINSIAPANCTVATDERGVVRFVFTNCDAGAYEYNGLAPTITVNPATLPGATYGVPYSQQLSASGSNGSYTFATNITPPPPGLSLSSGGLLSGTPTPPWPVGGWPFAVIATDGSGFQGSRNYTLTFEKAATTTSITSDAPDPSAVGETVTIKYTVVPKAPNTFTPTGMVTVSDGTQSCTASVAAGQCTIAFATLGAKTLTATYTGDSIFDGSDNGGAATHTVANRPPTAVGDVYSTNEDTTLTVPAPGFLVNDSDPDSGDSIHAELVNSPSHFQSAFVFVSNGSFSYTPSPNYNGPDSFTYKVVDNHGAASGVVTVSITVNPVNDPPTVVVAAGGSCSVTNPFQGTIRLTVADIDNPAASLTLSASSSNPLVLANGGVAFGGGSADRTATLTGTGVSGSSTVLLTVSDGAASTSTTLSFVMGKSSADVLNGGEGTDLLFGGASNDTLNGNGGNDLLCGGSADDVLNGGDGADTLDGGSGGDKLRGEGDDDTLTGGSGGDSFSGGAGTDVNTDFVAAQGDTRDGT